MRSIKQVGAHPTSTPLSADGIIEFHCARLLLLLHLSGIAGRIDGLTKMAKLDFFVRYPDFFVAACTASGVSAGAQDQTERGRGVESAMVRHHYGPWDKRYYHVLAHLEAKGLVIVSKHGNGYRLALTEIGREKAKILASFKSFETIAQRMRDVKKAFGGRSGNSLKKMIYKLFDEEVGQRPLGDVIQG